MRDGTLERLRREHLKSVNHAHGTLVKWKAPGVAVAPKGYRLLKLKEKVKWDDLSPIGPKWATVLVIGRGFKAIYKPYIRRIKATR